MYKIWLELEVNEEESISAKHGGPWLMWEGEDLDEAVKICDSADIMAPFDTHTCGVCGSSLAEEPCPECPSDAHCGACLGTKIIKHCPQCRIDNDFEPEDEEDE